MGFTHLYFASEQDNDLVYEARLRLVFGTLWIYNFSLHRLKLFYVEKSRFDNFSGFPCARLSRIQSVRGEGRKDPSLLFRVVSFLFFDVPTKYLKSLDGLYMDNVVFQAPFKIFVDRASSVWQQDVINVSTFFVKFGWSRSFLTHLIFRRQSCSRLI